jgi:hypothetical protein
MNSRNILFMSRFFSVPKYSDFDLGQRVTHAQFSLAFRVKLALRAAVTTLAHAHAANDLPAVNVP